MLGSDGNNVNKKVARLFNEELLEIRAKGLVDIGTCSIHTVHNAYLKSLECLGDYCSQLLIDIFYYFDGWPSRYEEFGKMQHDLKLPIRKFLKHSSTRWLTFGPAAELLLEQWDAVVKCFLKFIPSSKSDTMRSNSYKKIVSSLKVLIIKVKLLFAISLAEFYTKFTEKFQSNGSLVHLLYMEFHNLLQTIVGCISKQQTLKLFRSGICDEDILFQANNLLPLNCIIISQNVRQELANVKEQDKMLFLKQVPNCYLTGYSYIFKKTPFCFQLVKSLKCLHPEQRKKNN